MSYDKDLVSIIMPCFNSGKYVEESIISVLKQTYENWELIIVDDASSDNTCQIIKNIAENEKRIRLFELKSNQGAAHSRNYAISCAKGQYIAFLDSDDLWSENKLITQIGYMKNKEVGFSFSAYLVINERGEIQRKIKVPREISYKELLKNTIVGCLTVVIDREIIGDFRMPPIPSRQDTATWLSILKKGHKAFGIPMTLAYYREMKGSLSGNKVKMLKANWQMYRKVENLGFFYTIYCFSNYAINALRKRIG